MDDTLGTLSDASADGIGDALLFLEGALSPGEVVGRYLVREALGEGGMARVYRVEHRLLGTSHALKVLKASGSAVRERALREARIQASLRHPNVVAVRDVLEVRGHVGLLMDYAPGPTLQQRLAQERPPLDEALRWFKGILMGVREAHQQGVVHRDLKPSNVLMVEGEAGLEPLVSDFGLARVEGGEDIVRRGGAAGSPGYMAPEQLTDASSVDHRADLFGLGCILYELATGLRAFWGGDARSLAERILAGEYRAPEDVSPGLPARLTSAIHRCLKQEAAQRYPDIDALLDALYGEAEVRVTAPTGRVTFVFTDIEGSTRLWERAPEVMRQALRLHDTCLRRLTEEAGGYEVKHEGDALMLAFSEPAEAVAWCLEAQRLLAEAAWPRDLPSSGPAPGLRVRMGVHVGQVEAHLDPVSGRADYLGAPVNRAARVSSAAHGGQVLLSGETWAAAQGALGELRSLDLGEHRLLGIDGLVRLIEVQHPALDPRSFPPPRTLGGEASRPYLGLSRFGPQHAELFYGRSAELKRMADRVRSEGLVTLTGPSGTGKSSLIGAGLSKALGGVRVQVLRPGVDPMRALKAAVRELLPEGEAREGALSALVAAPERLGVALGTWALRSSTPCVLVVDQAEELLTLCEDPEQREAFAEAIVSLGADPALPMRAVLSVREDFFGRLATVRALRGRYSRSVEVLQPPELDQLIPILVEPAALFGYSFEDEALPRAMAEAVSGEPAALPLLQACAEQLWEARDRERRLLTWAAYHRLGGVRGALAAHAEAALGRLTDAQRVIARRLLLRLVSAQGTRLPASREALLQASGAPEQAEIVLSALIEQRLLTAGSATPDEDRVELVHEALVTQWDRLRAWLDEDKEGARIREALGRAAVEWDEARRSPGFLWRADRLAELRLWRERRGDPISDLERAFAEASERGERARLWTRRALGSAVVVVLAIFTLLLAWQLQASNLSRLIAEDALQESQQRALVAQAMSEEQAGRPWNAVALLRAADALTPEALGVQPLHSRLLRLMWAGAASHVLPMTAEALTLSPDGRVLAMFEGQRLRLVDLETGRARAVELEGAQRGDKVWEPWLAFSPDGRRLAASWSVLPPGAASDALLRDAAATADRRTEALRRSVVAWVDVEDGALLGSVDLPQRASAPTVSSAGARVALSVAGEAGGGLLVDFDAGPSVRRLERAAPEDVATARTFWSADGQHVHQLLLRLRFDAEGRPAGGLEAQPSRLVSWGLGGGQPLLELDDVHDVAPLAGGELLVLRWPDKARAPALSRLQVEGGGEQGLSVEGGWGPQGFDSPVGRSEFVRDVPGRLLFLSAGQVHELAVEGPRARARALPLDRVPEGVRGFWDAGRFFVMRTQGRSLNVLDAQGGALLREANEQLVEARGGVLISESSGALNAWAAPEGALWPGRRRARCEWTEDLTLALPTDEALRPWSTLCLGQITGISRDMELIGGRDSVVRRNPKEQRIERIEDGRVEIVSDLLPEQELESLHTAAHGQVVVALWGGGGLSTWRRAGEAWLRADADVGPGLGCRFSDDGERLLCLMESWELVAFDTSKAGWLGRVGGVDLSRHRGASWLSEALFAIDVAPDGFTFMAPGLPARAVELGDVTVTLRGPSAPQPGVGWVRPQEVQGWPTLVTPSLSLPVPDEILANTGAGVNPPLVFREDGALSVYVHLRDYTISDGRTGEPLVRGALPTEHGEGYGLALDGDALVLAALGSDDALELTSLTLEVPAPAEVSRTLGASTNLRVCRGGLEVVPVLPYPEPGTVWAPEALCGG
ncbi:MAG: protein kinase [Alphaproteobacteria bacterium]|nr:protein kinase [Alphaproteobacteria bacterium]MCB9796840.1 protein kinase [Alphaproteobacteria bacterium]